MLIVDVAIQVTVSFNADVDVAIQVTVSFNADC